MDCERLQNKLDRNSSYRKREILNLTIQIESVEGEVQKSLLRASFILLYAHFEGFTKQAIRLFLQHINSEQVPVKELKYHLQTLYHTKKIIDVKQSKRKIKYNELTTAILSGNVEPFKVEERDQDIVSTESNLKFDVIEDLLFLIGVTTENFMMISDRRTSIDTKQEFINRRILDARNAIAHGENTIITLDEYNEVKNFIIDFIDTLKEYLVDISVNKLYYA
ncbi:MAE_28990/MAE_18760 family HEPN-like nuclease [Bacillus sp. FJAT-42315]|uniref:MAE_28990/MAE_18760 family HEPN-like nuclease n=1 Tax=Bacillus sp. FJAT-42315 TaxID=2014077 RepID=UPI000C2328BD|nr:MAE_28990/MAE_18760 family HEPN-like nuclease [Bacillus sp. FJAT-42315]